MSTAAGPLRVLLIEDDDLVLRLLDAVLRRAGYEVLTAIDATAGLVIARRERPDLVLVDATLGRECGLTLLSELRTYPELAETVAMLMSGGDPVVLEDRAKAVGAGFIAKPVTPRELVEAVDEAIADGGARRAALAPL
jgi:DNA-binding response OmpR family regulator